MDVDGPPCGIGAWAVRGAVQTGGQWAVWAAGGGRGRLALKGTIYWKCNKKA